VKVRFSTFSKYCGGINSFNARDHQCLIPSPKAASIHPTTRNRKLRMYDNAESSTSIESTYGIYLLLPDTYGPCRSTTSLVLHSIFSVNCTAASPLRQFSSIFLGFPTFLASTHLQLLAQAISVGSADKSASAYFVVRVNRSSSMWESGHITI